MSEISRKNNNLLKRIRRFSVSVPLVLIASCVLMFTDDTRDMTVAAQMSQTYRYSLPEWELRNIGSKWVFKLIRLVPWSEHREDNDRIVSDYFTLVQEEQALVGKIAKNFTSQSSVEKIYLLEEKAKLYQERLSKRDLVEELPVSYTHLTLPTSDQV